MSSRKPKVAVLVDYYLPGFGGGGPLKAIAALVEELGAELSFDIMTRDRDPRDAASYPDVRPGHAKSVGRGMVWYFGPGVGGMRDLARALRSAEWDVLYLNSAFSARFTLFALALRLCGRLRASRTIIAPRGEFSPGALEMRAGRKRFFLGVAKALGLYDKVVWQASTELEADHIRATIGPRALVVIAEEIPPPVPELERTPSAKRRGALKAIFFSRISPKKNLDGALDLLAKVGGDVQFDIYGTREGERYWELCQQKIDALPSNVTARYLGPLPPPTVFETLAAYDLLILPTHGENYGYVIVEALLAGCPVFISDQTPWGMVRPRRAGSVVDLRSVAECVRELQLWVDMDADAHARCRSAAQALGREVARSEHAIVAARRLFGLREADATPDGYRALAASTPAPH